MTQDKLDKLLRQWAAAHATSEEHAQKLADRIVDELTGDDSVAVVPATDERVPVPRRQKLAYAAVGIAATLLIAATVSLLSRGPSVPNEVVPHNDGALLALASVEPSELDDSARLFDEMEMLFADDLRWIADTDSEVHLEIRPVSSRPTTGATPLLVRVVVVQRKSGETGWRKLLETDVLARSQELVETAAGPSADNQLLLWAYLLPDGKVAVDSSIRLTTPIRASVDVSNILSPGKPANVFSLKTEDAEYHILQMVTPLPKQEDASCTET
jgi:hypothetical protein